MEDSDELLLPVWRANLVLLTREVGAATRLARMMTFSASYLKLMLSGQREFSEEFVRGIEAVTGLPGGWMNVPHTEHDIPPNAREAIDNEQPLARFRGTAHPVRKKTVLRPPEPIFGQPGPAKRVEEEIARRGSASASGALSQGPRRGDPGRAAFRAASDSRAGGTGVDAREGGGRDRRRRSRRPDPGRPRGTARADRKASASAAQACGAIAGFARAARRTERSNSRVAAGRAARVAERFNGFHYFSR